MNQLLSRASWLALTIALCLLVAVPSPGARVRTHVRELCTLLAVWDPTRTTTSVVPEPARLVADRTAGPVSGAATITVNYSANFDTQARAAFQAAVDIWASQITSTVPITVTANWSALGSGVLGQAGSTFVYRDFGAGTAGTFYHAALASKLLGSDVDSASTDITATFNSAFPSWYFGTDSATPSDKYDFESVVLHELGHGLGFSGSGTDNGTTGGWGLGGGFPMIYDRFVESASRQAIINTGIFTNPSAALHTAFTSEVTGDTSTGLFWNGTAGGVAAGGGLNRPRLDALSPFSSGSNYSHVSEATYPAGNANSLMTRALSNGEVIHSPGAIVLGIFQDEGWVTPCSYTLSASAASVAAAASTGNSVTVTAPAGCAWTAVSNASWLTITGGASGSGNGAVTFSAAANTGALRTGTLTIAGQTFTVTQAAASSPPPPACAYAIAGPAATVSGNGGSVAVSVTTTAGCAWTASSNAAHITVATGSSGTGSGSVGLTVAASAIATARTGTVTIAGQLFTVTQDPACTYALSASGPMIAAAVATGSVAVTAGSGCPWTASSNASWLTITSGSSGSGTGTVGYSVAQNTGATSRVGMVTVAGIAHAVTQSAPPTMALDRSAMKFAAVSNGSSFLTKTAPQVLRLSQLGLGAITWTAVSNQPWLSVTPSSGSGSATLTVAANFASGLTLGTTSAGAITITLTGSTNALAPVTASLTVRSASADPAGSLDTPVNNTLGISGSVAVTGWALDDIEVTEVQIWRDPHPADPPGAIFAAGPPQGGKVLVGQASFVDGARPDIQAGNSESPLNSRAGWGYLMLTRGLIWDGQGPFKLYAIAADRDGHLALIGSTSISVANASATKPFGSIDTPGQGATVSGLYPNTGWVLTPNAGAAIPAANVQVSVDGVFLSGVPSVSDRADITAGFPSFTTTGAGRGLFVDTTQYANGAHTIGWLVTDSTGKADGVGSRFFTVANGALSVKDAPELPSPADLRLLREGAGAIAGRRGFDRQTPFNRLGRERGVSRIDAEELDRIELRFDDLMDSTLEGYLRVGDGLAALPIGSRLAGRTFTWQPGVGFVGVYDLVFVRRDHGEAVERHEVRVVLHPQGTFTRPPAGVIVR